MNKQEISATIDRVRVERGLSINKLSINSGVDIKRLSQIANRQDHGYRLDTLLLLLDALDLEIEIKERVH